MIIKISKLYNLFGNLVKGEELEDITTINCASIKLYPHRIVPLDESGNIIFPGEIKLDFMNYTYDFIEERK